MDFANRLAPGKCWERELQLMVLKSGDHQLTWVAYRGFSRVSYITGGAGFLPSTVPPPEK